MTKLNELASECHKIAVEHGFWGQISNPCIWSEKIALIHSEASEMLEAMRDGDENLLATESADLLIRLLDFTGARGIDLDTALAKKIEENRKRPLLHGRKF